MAGRRHIHIIQASRGSKRLDARDRVSSVFCDVRRFSRVCYIIRTCHMLSVLYDIRTHLEQFFWFFFEIFPNWAIL